MYNRRSGVADFYIKVTGLPERPVLVDDLLGEGHRGRGEVTLDDRVDETVLKPPRQCRSCSHCVTYSSSHMTLHHIEVVSLKSNLSVASVVSAKSFETGSRFGPGASVPDPTEGIVDVKDLPAPQRGS